MLDYAQTMSLGADRYHHELTALAEAGIPATFTQTGGMNAALQAILDGGAVLLVTDFDDTLAWDRADQQGWAVGLYPDPDSQDPIAFQATQDVSTEALTDLVRAVLAEGVRNASRPPT